jgi:ribosomal-protein-alanine N-acetyltransferase
MNPAEFFRDLPTIQTPRLTLRALRESDAGDVFAYGSDAELCRYTTWSPHESLADARKFLAFVLSQYEAGKPANWGIVENSTGKLVGTCGFMSHSLQHERAELGYAIARRLWAQGYMTEAVRAAIDCGFRSLALHKIDAHCDARNVGSARVMEKAGMSFEGLLRQHAMFKGERRDVRVYGILRDEWRTSLPGPLQT